MTLFDESTPQLAASPADGAAPPKLGFLDGMSAAYEATGRATNQLALDTQFRQNEQDQIRAIKQAGGNPHRSLNDMDDTPFTSPSGAQAGDPVFGTFGRPYKSVASFYENGAPDDGGLAAGAIGERNAAIMSLQKQFPGLGLKTYDQLWADTKQQMQDAAAQAAKPTSLAGSVGSFIGGAVGSMSPRTAPLTFSTLAAGPFGPEALAGRMALQAGAGGAADAASQLMGGDESQKLAGLGDGSFSLGQVAESAAGGAIGEGVMAGLGHGIGKGVEFAKSRGWFPDAPAPPGPRIEPHPPEPGEMAPDPNASGVQFRRDPANLQPDDGLPRVNPLDDYSVFRDALAEHVKQTYGSSQLATAMGQRELGSLHTQLDDWSGPEPWAVKPRTDTAPLPDVTHFDFGQPLTRALEQAGPEGIARRIDPDTFRQVDTLSRQMEESRARIQQLAEQRGFDTDAHVADLDAQVEAAQQKVSEATGKRRAAAQKQLADVTQRRDYARAGYIDDHGGAGDSPEMAAERAKLMKMDEQQRDLAPLVSRAFDAANGEWKTGRYNPDTIAFLRDLEEHPRRRFKPDEGAVQPTAAVEPRAEPAPTLTRPTLADRVPQMTTRPDVTDAMAGKSASEKLNAVLDANAKDMEPVLDRYQQQVAKLLNPEREEDASVFDAFHGTDRKYDAFDPSAAGRYAGRSALEEGAAFFTRTADEAASYGDRVLRARVRPGKTAIYDVADLYKNDPSFIQDVVRARLQDEAVPEKEIAARTREFTSFFEKARDEHIENERTGHEAIRASYDNLPEEMRAGMPLDELLKPSPVLPSTMARAGALLRARESGLDTLVLRNFEDVHGSGDQVIVLNRNNVHIPELGEKPTSGDVIRVNGTDMHLDKDTMVVPTADGEGSKTVSLRTYLQSLHDDLEAQKAISSCQISS